MQWVEQTVVVVVVGRGRGIRVAEFNGTWNVGSVLDTFYMSVGIFFGHNVSIRAETLSRRESGKMQV